MELLIYFCLYSLFIFNLKCKIALSFSIMLLSQMVHFNPAVVFGSQMTLNCEDRGCKQNVKATGGSARHSGYTSGLQEQNVILGTDSSDVKCLFIYFFIKAAVLLVLLCMCSAGTRWVSWQMHPSCAKTPVLSWHLNMIHLLPGGSITLKELTLKVLINQSAP